MREDQDKALIAPGAPAGSAVCVHHWVIDAPSGPVSLGSCKLCGERREFRNYVDNTPYWEDDVSLDQVSSGASFRPQEVMVDADERGDE